MKKTILLNLPLLALSLLAGCTTNSSDPLNFKSSKEEYGFQAMTAVNLLSLSPTSSSSLSAKRAPTLPSEDEKSEILHYLDFASQMLNGDSLFKMTESTSDLDGYAKKMDITATDLDNNKIHYTMYYNEVLEVEEDDDDFFENDREEEFSIRGIMILDDVTYDIFGEKEIENDEMETSLTAKLGDRHYVTVEQEFENNEIEYAYTIFKDGVKEEFSIEIENERNGRKISVGKEVNGHEKEISFKMMDSSNGVTKIKVIVEEENNDRDEKDKIFIIEVSYDENNNPIYTFIE